MTTSSAPDGLLGRTMAARRAAARCSGDRHGKRSSGLVARARLVRELSEAGDVPLALVVAPAGYGKTTLLTEWAARDPRPFRWIGAETLPHEAVARIARAERATRPHVLVVDDAHAVTDAAALAALSRLAEGMPAGSQLVVAGRREPALAVGRLRAHRKVVELRPAELAMSRSEAAELVGRAGLRLTDSDVDTLVTRTEGWPVGLYLAAVSLGTQPDVHAAVERFAGDDTVVADYLRDELLAPLSAAHAEFVLRTAMLETLSGPVCDAVLDTVGSGATLVELARAGVPLVGLDRSGESYRYHRLFAEMLRAELRRTDRGREARLHRRASAWFMGRGETGCAIRHARAAGGAEAAAVVLWPHGADRIAHGRNREVGSWLARFTPDEIAASAPLALTAAARALAEGNRPRLQRLTAEAAGRVDTGRGRASRSVEAALTLLQACGDSNGMAGMAAHADAARTLGPDGGTWSAMADWLDGVSQHLRGSHEAARSALEEGGRGGAASAPFIQAQCLAQLALLVLDDANDWDQAAVLAGRARAQTSVAELAQYPTASLVFAVSALVRADRGMIDEAVADLTWSSRLLGRLVDFMPWYEAETRIVLAGAAVGVGDTARARMLLAEAADRVTAVPDAPVLHAWIDQRRGQLEGLAAKEASALTQAELRVLQLLPTHLSVPAIARRLYVSPNTVKTHVRAVYRKLHASSRAEAVARASAAGLLDDVQVA